MIQLERERKRERERERERESDWGGHTLILCRYEYPVWPACPVAFITRRCFIIGLWASLWRTRAKNACLKASDVVQLLIRKLNPTFLCVSVCVHRGSPIVVGFRDVNNTRVHEAKVHSFSCCNLCILCFPTRTSTEYVVLFWSYYETSNMKMVCIACICEKNNFDRTF